MSESSLSPLGSYKLFIAVMNSSFELYPCAWASSSCSSRNGLMMNPASLSVPNASNGSALLSYKMSSGSAGMQMAFFSNLKRVFFFPTCSHGKNFSEIFNSLSIWMGMFWNSILSCSSQFVGESNTKCFSPTW